MGRHRIIVNIDRMAKILSLKDHLFIPIDKKDASVSSFERKTLLIIPDTFQQHLDNTTKMINSNVASVQAEPDAGSQLFLTSAGGPRLAAARRLK